MRVIAALLAFMVLVAARGQVATAQPADPRMFPQTGYRVDNDAFWDYFQRRGGLSTFGFPASQEFTFLGCATQFYQRLVMQRCGGGGIATLNLLDEGLLPYTTMDGSTFPGPNGELTAGAPRPDDPNYGPAVVTFVRGVAPDTFEGEPVNFGRTFFGSISPELAGTSDQSILGLLNLELWGFPTSQPAYDPTNRGFIYQRFQRGIMHYDKSCGCTRGLLLAEYLKAIVTGQNLPPDLEAQAAGSPLLRSAVNGLAPAGTNYSGAFNGVEFAGRSPAASSGAEPAGPPPTEPTTSPKPTATSPPKPTSTREPGATSTPVPPPVNTPAPAPTAIPQSPLSADEAPPAGSVSKSLKVTEPIGAGDQCSPPTVGSALTLQAAQNDGAQGTGNADEFAFPAIPRICFTGVPAQTSTQMKVTPKNTPAQNLYQQAVTPDGSGWPWPVPEAGPLPAVGTYTVTASQAGQASGAAASTVTTTVSIVAPTQPRVLVLPRFGPPGTSFRIFLGGFKPNSDVFLRLYRCVLRPQCEQNQTDSSGPANHVFATSLGPIKTDASGQATYTLRSQPTDPKTEFAVFSDDMLSGGNPGGIFSRGKAWFCTTKTGCKTE
jgi:hypothetical protein